MDSVQSHWKKSRHRRGYCEMHILLHNIIIDFEDYCCLHSRLSQRDSLSLPPTRATRKQRTNKLGRCYQPERPFCTLIRYTLRRRTAPFTYMCLSPQVSGRETRVHAGRWHAGHSVRCHPTIYSWFYLPTLSLNKVLGMMRKRSWPTLRYNLRISRSNEKPHENLSLKQNWTEMLPHVSQKRYGLSQGVRRITHLHLFSFKLWVPYFKNKKPGHLITFNSWGKMKKTKL
jgi:hypothetical protein